MNNTTTYSFPTLSVLGIIFITLKLTNYIAWSWWWVLAPFWIPVLTGVSLLLLALLIGTKFK